MGYKTIGELCTVKGGKRLPKDEVLVDYKTKHPYIRISDFNHDSIDKNKIKYLTDDVYEKIKNYVINTGDIFLSIVGTIGLVDIINEDLDFSNLTENAVKISSNDNCSLLTEYLYYYLKSPQGQHEMNIRTVGSTQPKLAITRIRDIPIPIVNISEQQKIVSILKNIDEKMKVNREIITNLEELSQTLFKRWFVDFEFPSDKNISYKSGEGQFIDSLPIGWIRTRADSIYSINIGKTPPRKLRDLFSDYEGEKWVSISDMKEDGPYLFDTKEYLNPKAVKEYRVKVAPKNSILLSFKLTIGRVKIAHTDLTTNEAIAHFIQTDKSPPYEYTYLYLKYFNYNELGNTSSIATAVNSKIIKAMPILVPDIKTLTKFQEIVSPLFNSIRSYQLQNKSLAELRDTLLPKLMSGEIELPDELEVDEHAELLQ